MLYHVVGNDEEYYRLNFGHEFYPRSQDSNERLNTECSAENRELRENPNTLSHHEPVGESSTQKPD